MTNRSEELLQGNQNKEDKRNVINQKGAPCYKTKLKGVLWNYPVCFGGSNKIPNRFIQIWICMFNFSFVSFVDKLEHCEIQSNLGLSSSLKASLSSSKSWPLYGVKLNLNRTTCLCIMT